MSKDKNQETIELDASIDSNIEDSNIEYIKLDLNQDIKQNVEIVENDNIDIEGKILCHPKKDSPFEILAAMGNGLVGFAKHINKHNPDGIIILGDRYEMLAAARDPKHLV